MEPKVDERQADATEKLVAMMNKGKEAKGGDTAVADKPEPPKTEIKDKGAEDKKASDTPQIDEGKVVNDWLKKEFNGTISSVEDLKGALAKKPNQEPTPEEKEVAQKNYQSQIVREFISEEGNSLDKWNSIQQRAAKDKTDLVREEFYDKNKSDLEGLSAEEKDVEFKKFYNIDETLFTEKEIKRGMSVIEKRGEKLQNKILQPVKDAEARLKQKYDTHEQSSKWAQEVDEFAVKELPSLKTVKKLLDKLGEVEMVVPDDIYAGVVDQLKDMKKFAARFSDNGKTDKKKLAEFIIKADMFDKWIDHVSTEAYGKGTKDATAHLPSAPDFSAEGKQGNQNAQINDAVKEAMDHNANVNRNAKRRR